MTEITLRKIAAADLPELLALYGQPSFNDGRVASLDEAAAIFARIETYPDYAIYFAETGGEVVGSLALMIIDNIAHWGKPTAMIENVVVREGRQGAGIGGAMMRAACEMAAAKGAYKVALSSNLRNERGHAFYEGLGFEKHGFSFRLELSSPSPLAGEGGEGEPARRAAALDHPTQRPAGFPLSNSPPQGGRGQAEDILDGAAS